MQKVFIGTAVQQRRKELGLTQEQLCQGICEPVTISRLENGQQYPSQARLSALLERLDISSEHHVALVSKNELEIDALQREIVAHNVYFERASKEDRASIREEALRLHKELEAIMTPDDMLSRQLILRSRVLLGKEDGNGYSFDEQLTMLTDAIRFTSPAFDLDEIGRGLYMVEEIKIINQIGNAYSQNGDSTEAIHIWSQLYKYIQKHFHNIPLTQVHMNMVAYNYAIELGMAGQYKKALKIADEGYQLCVKHGHFQFLPGFLAIMADSFHRLGDDEKSMDYYRQAYFTYKGFGDCYNREIIREEVVNYFGIYLD